MALNHCWGIADFSTFRERCTDSMKEGVVWSSLPKPFQDAVTDTMWFKIKNLWIHSFCNIQDSHEDWKREFKVIEHIYKHSFLTIAATRAVDAPGGLFVDRNPEIVRISRVRAQWSRELEDDYLFMDGLFRDYEIFESPLMNVLVCVKNVFSYPVCFILDSRTCLGNART